MKIYNQMKWSANPFVRGIVRFKRRVWNCRIRLWWCRLWIRSDSDHWTLQQDVEALTAMTRAEKHQYQLDLVRRRSYAYDMALGEIPVPYRRKKILGSTQLPDNRPADQQFAEAVERIRDL